MKPLLLLLLLLLFTFLSSTGAGTGTLLSDAIALASLRKALNTPATSTLDSWNTSNLHSVCSWLGVRCAGGRVVSLELSNLNISSTYTSLSISNLSSLLNLSLAGNAFDCEIELSSMPNLLYLNLSTNQFNGDLNWDYSTLQSLEVFDVYDNNFTAPLPAGVTSLKRLRHLDLGGNYFYGTIPASYGSLRNLKYLQLAGNDLRGRIPGELGNLTSLTELSLGYYNSFEGGIPAELGKLVSLVNLDLSKCSLDGEIPKHLGSLFNLNTLYLHSNLLSGNIPSSIGNLTSLLFLDLSNNGLTGEIPVELANLQQLRLLNLFLNRLHGSLPEYLAEMPSLETLGLFMNNFTGPIPENLGSNGRIQLLDLSSNKFTGTVPNSLCSSNQLRVLILFNNFLFGAIPETLGNCLSLAKLRMGQNYLNGTIPSGLLYLPKLFLLELQNNYLSGPLSESQNNNNNINNNNNSQLAQLNLSNNLLSGPLPSSISILSSLQTLLVSDNRLQGPVPASIGSLHQLVKLDLSSNALSGSIPPEISNCSQLTYLDLSQNNLSGDIPQEISGIEILNYLNLSRNHFSHSIPKSIGLMKSLTSADFSFNDFSGRLPDTGQFAYFNASAFAGNPRLCGAVLNNPCNLSAIPATTAATTRHVSGDFKLVFALSLLVCSLIFAIVAIIKARAYKQGNGDKAGAWKLTTFQRVEFSIADVLECMKDSNVIGRGGAGVVYIGRTPSGQEFAVKRLLGFSTGGHDHGFKAEVKTLANIRHRNIVRLLAFCSNSEMNVLVYEFMSNGSLGELLHGKGGGFLGWDRRYRIALEAARGLCYLHHDCCPMIVHRDVKSNNILLDSQLEAHVADFGLAKFLQDSAASQCMSAIAGSYGYIAPEYAYTLRVDEKSDVYSYGVVLLELITGRRPVGGFGDGVDIVQWAKKTTGCNKDNVASIVDSRLSTLPVDEAMHVFFVAMLCVQENSVERPTMREVVQMLTEIHRHAALEQSPSSSSSDHHKIDSHCYKLFPDLLT